MLADNIVYLRRNDPNLYEVLKRREEDPTEPLVILEETKNNQKTLKITKEDKSLYLHSKYDPIKEAELIIDRLEEKEEISDDTHVIFYGLGLGYHVDAFLKRYPKNDFSIYEPSIQVLNHYLDQIPLNHLPLKQLMNIQCECEESGLNAFFKTLITGGNKKHIICDLPPYQMVFREEYQLFLNQFRDEIKRTRSSIHTNYAYKKKWILNSVENFKEVLRTPNIIMENNNIFKGKKAILVSAGPSLDYEIENLKLIKEQGLAYIFCVGSAINTLLQHSIQPDAMCTYDPTELNNQLVFKKINEMKLNSIPLIFGSSVGFEVLHNYIGPKYHMITNQDMVALYFLKTLNDEVLQTVMDAPSIAVVTVELLHKLGFEQIILVGQNLAYLNEKNYAAGIEYHNEIDNIESRKAEDVLGRIVFTTDAYLSMKKIMETYIKIFDLQVINTTKGGIKIEGTQYIEMDEVIKETLKTSIVDGAAFKNILPTELYDQTYMKTQLTKIMTAYENFQGLLFLIKQQLIKMEELVINKNVMQASIMHKKLDVLIAELEENDFSKVFAFPMNRVEYDLLAMSIQQIKKEKNELNKIRQLIPRIGGFINLLYEDSRLDQEIMEILTKDISAWSLEIQGKV